MKKLLVALLILITIGVGAGMYFAPAYVEKALQRQAAEYLGRELQVGKIRLKPLSFSVHLEQVVLSDSNGMPLFTVSQIEAGTSFWGFWARTGQFRRLSLQEPTLFIEDGARGRLQFIELLSDLFTAAAQLPEKTLIASLSLEQASVVLLDRSLTPTKQIPYLSFNLTTKSFDSAREGSFQLSGEISERSTIVVEGELKWEGAGARGQFSLMGLDRKNGLSLNSGFTAAFSKQDLDLKLTQAELSGTDYETGLQQLIGFATESLSVNFDVGLTFDGEGLLLRDGTAEAGEFVLRGLGRGSSAAIEIPVRKARLNFSGFAFQSSRPGEFDLLMYTEPAGGVQVIGRYEPGSRNGEATFHIVEVPLASLIPPSRDLIPPAISSEILSADGSIQLCPEENQIALQAGLVDQFLMTRLERAISKYGSGPVATLLLGGQFNGGGRVSLVGYSNPSNPLKNSYVGGKLEKLDATLASPLTLDLANQSITSGSLEASLGLHIADGRLTGHQDLSAFDLVLDHHSRSSASKEGPLDFSLALLQDAENRVDFSFPVDTMVDDELQFSRLISQAISDHLLRVAAEPFETLALMLGTESSDLEMISFVPGQAALTTTAVAQVEWLKTALQWRPGLSLVVSGAYDPEADRFALAHQQVRLHVLLATAADAEFRASSSPILFSDPKVQIVLDEFAGSRLGAEAVNTIAERFDLAGEAGELLPSAAENQAYYRALFEALVIHEEISERALLSLARYRSRAVIDQLVRHGVERPRLSRGEQQAVSASVIRGVPVSIELGVFHEPLELDKAAIEPEIRPVGDETIE